MEAVRWFRGLAPVAALALLAAVGLGRPPALVAADPPWQPPPCSVVDPAAVPQSAPAAWYRMDPVLDRAGTLAGQRLALGVLGAGSRHVDLPPESFASGPVLGRLLVGDDDGSSSRLRVVDVARGCATVVAREADVIRSALLSPDGVTIWEHRVDRASRTDEGIWRRPADQPAGTRILPGLPSDDRYGPTFATELRWTGDGRLGVASCGELACRSRVLDPATGRVSSIEATGPMIGVDGDTVVAYDACHGFPCPILAVDAVTGRRKTLVDDSGAASLGAADDHLLVFEAARGSLETLDLRTGIRRPVEGGAGLLPVRGGSLAASGADLPAGDVLVAPDGLVTEPAEARGIDPLTSAVEAVEETSR